MVGQEVAAVQNAVGLCEVNGFNRIEITGPDAQSFLDRLICGRLPRKQSRVGLTYLLNQHGMLKVEATIANLPASDRGPDRLWYGSAAAAEYHDMDWLRQHVRPDEKLEIRSLINDQTILVLAGPKARQVLSAVSQDDWSAEAFPWLSVRECFVGIAPVTVSGVSFSGELAYEIHVPNASLYSAYAALREAGERVGMRLFGNLAVDSMRLEKGYLHWKAEIITEFDPFEAGLDRFVTMDKAGFVGKSALALRQEQGPRQRLVTLVLDSRLAAAHSGASVMKAGEVVGTVTSGAWGHRIQQNLALAYVVPHLASIDTALEVDVLGTMVAAKVIAPSPYDPDLTHVRKAKA